MFVRPELCSSRHGRRHKWRASPSSGCNDGSNKNSHHHRRRRRQMRSALNSAAGSFSRRRRFSSGRPFVRWLARPAECSPARKGVGNIYLATPVFLAGSFGAAAAADWPASFTTHDRAKHNNSRPVGRPTKANGGRIATPTCCQWPGCSATVPVDRHDTSECVMPARLVGLLVLAGRRVHESERAEQSDRLSRPARHKRRAPATAGRPFVWPPPPPPARAGGRRRIRATTREVGRPSAPPAASSRLRPTASRPTSESSCALRKRLAVVVARPPTGRRRCAGLAQPGR
jgi:hypothetical protein